MGGLGFGSHADSIAPVPWYSWVLNPLLGALLGFYIPMLFSYAQGIPFVDKSPSPEELSYTCAGMGARQIHRRMRAPATEEARRALGSVQERCKLSQREAAVERLQHGLKSD